MFQQRILCGKTTGFVLVKCGGTLGKIALIIPDTIHQSRKLTLP